MGNLSPYVHAPPTWGWADLSPCAAEEWPRGVGARIGSSTQTASRPHGCSMPTASPLRRFSRRRAVFRILPVLFGCIVAPESQPAGQK